MNYNTMRFDLSEFSPETKIVREAKLTWVPFSTVIREEHVLAVRLTDLQLQDTLFQFSQLTEENHNMFSIAYVSHRPMEYDFPI